MVERDRELLARGARANQALGRAVVELLHHSARGELPAAGVRVVGENLAALGADLLARADELEWHPVIDGSVVWREVGPEVVATRFAVDPPELAGDVSFRHVCGARHR